jgi:hypothetical protein
MEDVAGRKRVDGNHARRQRSPLVSGVEPQEANGTYRMVEWPMPTRRVVSSIYSL